MSDNFLSDKKILFFGIGFYDYEEKIIEQIKKFGGEVTFYLDQPKYLQIGIVQRIGNFFSINFDEIRAKYQNEILKELKNNNFDYIFVLKGEYLQTFFIKLLKEKFSAAQFIMYQWDSLNRVPNAFELMPYFDRVLSFDRQDCEQLPQLQFRPLFFRNEPVYNTIPLKYDLVFIGWLHADRLSASIAIQKICNTYGLKSFFYLFTGLTTYFQNLIRGTAKNLSFKSLNYKQVNDYINSSKVVLDIPHPLQSGLTMRTIEAIGSKKKLITTNFDIVNYDFYNSQNILLIDLKNLKIDKSFFETTYVELPLDIYKKYTLEEWVDDIFYLNKKCNDYKIKFEE